MEAPAIETWLQGEAPPAEADTVLYLVFEAYHPAHSGLALEAAQHLRAHAASRQIPVVGLTTLGRGTSRADAEALLEAHEVTFPVAHTRDHGFLASIGTHGLPWAALVVDGRLAWAGHPSHLPQERLENGANQVPPR